MRRGTRVAMLALGLAAAAGGLAVGPRLLQSGASPAETGAHAREHTGQPPARGGKPLAPVAGRSQGWPQSGLPMTDQQKLDAVIASARPRRAVSVDAVTSEAAAQPLALEGLSPVQQRAYYLRQREIVQTHLAQLKAHLAELQSSTEDAQAREAATLVATRVSNLEARLRQAESKLDELGG